MSEMTPEGGVEVLTIDVTEIVGDLEIPCDWDRIFHCGPKSAQWVAGVRCGCGASGQRLICEGCKSLVLQMDEGLRCPGECDMVFVPARKAIAFIEPLNQRA